MKLKEKVKYHRNMQDHFRDEANMYKDLLDIWIHQTKLSNLQKEHLLSIIDEVEVLLEKYSSFAKDKKEKSNYEILLAIIENWKNRYHLDTILSNRDVAEWQKNFSDIEEEEEDAEEIPDNIKELYDENKWKFVLYDFELVKLVWLLEDEYDYYYEFLKENWEIEEVSCCVWFIPLYGFLSDDDYDRLDTYRDLNVENDYEE